MLQDELIHEAIRVDNVNEIVRLVSIGSDFKNNIAFVRAAAMGRLDIVKFLINSVDDIRPDMNRALAAASRNGKLEVVIFLLSIGASSSAVDHRALQWASRLGNLSVTRVLLMESRLSFQFIQDNWWTEDVYCINRLVDICFVKLAVNLPDDPVYHIITFLAPLGTCRKDIEEIDAVAILKILKI